MTDDRIKPKGRFLGLERAEWWFWIKWVLANTVAVFVGVGGVLSVGEVLSVGGVLSGSVFWSVFGVALGTAQWLILRKRVHQSGWWILASVAGLAVGGAAFVGVVSAVGGVSTVGMALFWPPAVFGPVFGAITGLVMILLLRHPIPETREPQQGEIVDQGDNED